MYGNFTDYGGLSNYVNDRQLKLHLLDLNETLPYHVSITEVGFCSQGWR